MGLWKRLLGREEEANAFGQPVEASVEVASSTPLMSFRSRPIEATWSTVMVNGKPLAPEQAQAFTSAFEQLGNLASVGTSQVLDLRNVPGLRDKVFGAMRDHANDPVALQAAVLEALGGAGAEITDPNAATSVPPPADEPGDPVGRLKQLDELRDQGVLTDAEFDTQKKKLLEEL